MEWYVPPGREVKRQNRKREISIILTHHLGQSRSNKRSCLASDRNNNSTHIHRRGTHNKMYYIFINISYRLKVKAWTWQRQHTASGESECELDPLLLEVVGILAPKTLWVLAHILWCHFLCGQCGVFSLLSSSLTLGKKARLIITEVIIVISMISPVWWWWWWCTWLIVHCMLEFEWHTVNEWRLFLCSIQ